MLDVKYVSFKPIRGSCQGVNVTPCTEPKTPMTDGIYYSQVSSTTSQEFTTGQKMAKRCDTHLGMIYCVSSYCDM